MNTLKYGRPMAAVAAALVFGLTAFTVMQAYAVTTVASASRFTLAVPAGGSSTVFGLASLSTPVHVMATQLNGGGGAGTRGTAHAVLASSALGFAPSVTWSGQHYTGAFASGNSGAAGASVVVVAAGGTLRLNSATTLRLTNASVNPHTYVVTQVW